MKPEIEELAEWLIDEDEEYLFDHVPLPITDLHIGQQEYSLLAALADLAVGDFSWLEMPGARREH